MGNYRHPAPRRGEAWVHFAGICFDSGGSGGSAGSQRAPMTVKKTIHRANFSGKWTPNFKFSDRPSQDGPRPPQDGLSRPKTASRQPQDNPRAPIYTQTPDQPPSRRPLVSYHIICNTCLAKEILMKCVCCSTRFHSDPMEFHVAST